MKLIFNFVTTAVLLAVFNTAFATDGRKEAVLDMGKGAFTLTVSANAEGPYDFGKNPGIGKAMDGQFQYKEVMFIGKTDETNTINLMATAQKIDKNKQGKKLSAENMAEDQIKAIGFEGRAGKFNCPQSKIEGSSMACYKMTGDAIFNGKKLPEKYSAILISVSWANDTQGYALIGRAIETNVERYNTDPSYNENLAGRALTDLWKNHKLTKN
jgi:hypothetical protein